MPTCRIVGFLFWPNANPKLAVNLVCRLEWDDDIVGKGKYLRGKSGGLISSIITWVLEQLELAGQCWSYRIKRSTQSSILWLETKQGALNGVVCPCRLDKCWPHLIRELVLEAAGKQPRPRRYRSGGMQMVDHGWAHIIKIPSSLRRGKGGVALGWPLNQTQLCLVGIKALQVLLFFGMPSSVGRALLVEHITNKYCTSKY